MKIKSYEQKVLIADPFSFHYLARYERTVTVRQDDF